MTTPLEFRSVLFAVFWKSGIVLGTALCLTGLLRSRSADLRRLILSSAIIAMFVAAAAMPVLPRWTAMMPSWLYLQSPASVAATQRSPHSPNIDAAKELTTPIPPQILSRGINVTDWLIPFAWFAGAAILLVRFASNLRGLYGLQKSSHAVTDACLLTNVARFGRRLRLWRNDAIGTPVTWGIVRPVILLPTGFEELPEESRDAVIRHEMAHIQAHDFLVRALAEIARALIWFQPLVWIVRRQLREEQELACDNCVLAAGGRPSAYAKLLLDWDARHGMDSLVAVGMAHQNCLKRRLYALLDTSPRRDKVANVGVVAALFVALAGALPLAAITLTQAVQPAPPQATPQTAARPRFDVVAIKPCKPVASSGVPVFAGNSSPGNLRIDCGILADTDNTGLIQVAYNRYATGRLTSFGMIPIEGGPDWIHSERYEIDAKADGQPGLLMMQGPMLQTILEDRFKLKIHRETRQGPVYELALSKGAPKLKPLPDGGCIPPVMGGPLPTLQDGQRRCRNMASPRAIEFEGGTLSMFAGSLGMVLDRPVIDKTGITGNFEIHLAFSPDDSPSDAPHIFQAIQEQLGLRLVPARGPMDVLVIDHVEKPTEN